MLEDYLKEALRKMEVSEKQKSMFLEILQDIKTNEALFSEFQTIKSFGKTEDRGSSEFISTTENDKVFDDGRNTLFEGSNLSETIEFTSEINEETFDTRHSSEILFFDQNEEEQADILSEEEDVNSSKIDSHLSRGNIPYSQETINISSISLDSEEVITSDVVEDANSSKIVSQVPRENTSASPQEVLNISGDPFDLDDTVDFVLIEDPNSSEIETINDWKTQIHGGEKPTQTQDVLENSHLKNISGATEDFLGKYKKIGLLGKGGMGSVWRIQDLVLDRHLALKIIHSHQAQFVQERSNFMREARINAQLQHPGIVPVHEFGELPNGTPYFTMREVKGRTFREVLKSVHKASAHGVWRSAPDGWNFRRLIAAFYSVCETIAYAHSKGVIHQDLKPSNIMIGEYGEVLVVDWGLAKQCPVKERNSTDSTLAELNQQSSTIPGDRFRVITGSPSYMAPEQAAGRADLIDERSDIYCLGSILYEILAGRTAYQGSSAVDIIRMKCNEDPLPVRSEQVLKGNPNRDGSLLQSDDNSRSLPDELVDICEKSMQRERSDRHQSATVLAKSVQSWLEGAQKRDKALKEFEAAAGILTSAIEQETSYTENWSQANQRIQVNDFENERSWVEWTAGSKAKMESQQLRRDYRRVLQGALVYDAELEEANEALATLLLEDIILAQAKGERRQREILERQFKGYLQYLSKRMQERLTSELEKRKQDDIRLLRAQRGSLIGRIDLRKDIASTLKEKSRLVSLIGTAGVGKTRLALEVIYDLQESQTETYFCNLTEANSELGVALSVAKAMNIKLRNVDPIGQLGEIFSKQMTILVLDNLEQVVENVGKVITRWMEQSESLRIIATSRIKLRLPQEHSFPIRPLSLLEGMELFTKRGQQADGQFFLNKESRNTVGRLVQQLDNLPLAIELAAARLNIFSVEEVETRLKERFSLLRSRTKGTQALQGALDWSWDLLKPWAKAALSQTAVFRSGFDVSAAEKILDCGDLKEAPPIFDILQDLSENSLLQQRKDSEGHIRYELLESIRQYSRGKLKDEDALEEGLSGAKANRETELRHAEYFSGFGRKEFLDSLENQGSLQNWGTFFDDLDNFVAGTEYGSGKTASLCCMAAMKILGMKGPISLGVNVVEETLKKTDLSSRQTKQLEVLRTRFLRISGRMNEARGERRQRGRRKSDKSEEGIVVSEVEKRKDDEIISNSESGSAKTSETEEANVEQYSENEKQDLRVEADELLEKGNLEEAESFYDEALEYYQQAFTVYQRIGELKGLVEVLQKMAVVFRDQGKYKEALEYFEDALQIAESQGFNSMKAHLYLDLGTVFTFKANYKKALEVLQRGLDINTVLNDRFLKAKILGNLGNTYIFLGQIEDALKSFEEALSIAREIGDKRGEGRHLARLGAIYRDSSQYAEALKSYEDAHRITRDIGDKKGEGGNLGNLGTVYHDLGENEEALKYHREALVVTIEIGDKQGRRIHLGNIGLIYQNLGQNEEALKYLQQALRITKEIEDKRGEGVCLGNLGDIFLSVNRLEESKKHFLQAIDIGDECFPIVGGVFRGSLALLHARQGNIEEAEIALEVGEPLVAVYPTEHGKFLCKKSKVYHLGKQTKEAEKALDHAQKIATELNAAEDSELGKAIAETKAFLSSEPRQPKLSPSKDIETQELSHDDKEDLRVEADELLEKGNLEEAASFYDKALEYYQQASAVYQRIGELKGLVEVLQKMANVLQNQGKYKDALELLEGALKIAETHGFNSTKAHLYSALGIIYESKSNYKKALEVLQKGLEINKVLNDRFLEAKIFGNLGVVYQNLGQNKETLKSYSEALKITREIGDRRGEGVHLGRLGTIYQILGEYENALDSYEEALDITREIGDKRGEGNHLGSIGIVYHKLGQNEEAISYLEPAIRIAREIKDKGNEGVNLGNLGTFCQELGRNEEAIRYLQQALGIAREIGDKRSEGINLGNLGDIFLSLNRLEESKIHLLQAIDICDASLPVAGGAFRGTLALLHAKQGDLEEAEIALEVGESLVAAQPSEYGKFLCKRAKVYHLAKQPKEVEKAIGHAKAITTELNAAEDSELGKAIAKTEEFLSGKSSLPKPLLSQDTKYHEISADEKEDLRVEADELLEKGNLEEAEAFYDEALELYQQATTIYQRIGDLKGLVEVLQKMADVFQYKGKYKDALELLENALQIAETHGFNSMKAHLYWSLGIVYHSQSNYKKALELCQKGLEINQVLNDRFLECGLLGSIGTVYKDLGQSEGALKSYEEALRIAREIGDRRGEGNHLGNIGTVYKDSSQYAEALKSYEEAFRIAREIGDKRGEGDNLGRLGTVYQILGQNEESLKSYEGALGIAQKIGDKRSEGIHLGNLGNVYQSMGQNEEALKSHEEALRIARKIGYKSAEGDHLGNIGIIYRGLGQNEEALKSYEEALGIAQEIGDKGGEGRHLGNLGNVYLELGQYEEALKYIQQALRIAREVGNKIVEGINLGNLGDIFLILNRLEESKTHLLQAIDICDESTPFAGGSFRGSLALLYARQGNIEEAKRVLAVGEPLVAVYALEYGKFLCNKAKVYHLGKRRKEAEKALEHAKAIATEINATEDSELGEAIAETKVFLN